MKTAIIEIDFDPELMFDENSAIKEHGSYLKAMQWLFKQDGMGIFKSGKERLVEIKEKTKGKKL